MFNFKVCTSNINTRILTQVIQYPNISNDMLPKKMILFFFENKQ
jgi:hypothetical protein